MKVVILAGGRGTRLIEETELLPKPMVEIGGKPIIWHIMKIYSHYGFNDFIICLGYKGYVIKEYFSHYFLHTSDITIDMSKNKIVRHDITTEPWSVTMVDTGIETMTGGRLKRIEKYVKNKTFMMTYGDGLADIDLPALLECHKKSKSLATVTAVKPVGRFGSLDIGKGNMVKSFLEKPKGDNSWINGGFFVLGPEIFKYIEGDHVAWEGEPMEELVDDGKLCTYKHEGFWKPMDTLRDKTEFERLWQTKKAPWKIW